MRFFIRALTLAFAIAMPLAPAAAWEYKKIAGCKILSVKMRNGQIVPVIDDHKRLVAVGSSACAPAGDHIEFVRPTGPNSVHIDGIYPATGRTWHADMRLPSNWKHSGRQPQLQASVRDRG